jgi:hypothetical protein
MLPLRNNVSHRLWMHIAPHTSCNGGNAFCIRTNACGMLRQRLCNTAGLDGWLPLANQRCGRPVAREGTTP